MSIEVDDLQALYTAFLAADNAWRHMIFGTPWRGSDTPGPSWRPELVNAWCDYQIAKRRYERALLVSRRGEDVLRDIIGMALDAVDEAGGSGL